MIDILIATAGVMAIFGVWGLMFAGIGLLTGDHAGIKEGFRFGIGMGLATPLAMLAAGILFWMMI